MKTLVSKNILLFCYYWHILTSFIAKIFELIIVEVEKLTNPSQPGESRGCTIS